MRLLMLISDRDHSQLPNDLRDAGYETTTCASVMAATALVEEYSPRFVFVDIKVRGAIDFVRWLKKETGCGAIALLGEDNDKDYPVTGFDGWLRPPYDAQIAIEALSRSGGLESKEAGESAEDESFWDITSEIRAAFQDSEDEKSLFNQPDWENRQNSVQVISQEVISLWGAKGGVGRTTLAIQLGRYLSDFDVLLIDLNLSEGPGDVNAILNLPSSPHIGKLLEEKSDRRRGFMESLIKPAGEPFAIVQPPPTIDQAEQICPDDIIELIDQARRCFQIVIVDLPPDLSPVTLEAIDLSTAVLFINDEHIGGLARIEALKAFVRKDIIKALVLNRFNKGLGKAKELSYFLDTPLGAAIPDFDRQIEKQISGKIKKDCDSIINKGVEEIVEAVFGIAKRGKPARNNLGRLIKGAISNIVS
jgi:MinD-like ATPase involved in chromosome partitioning or flagellar assembly/CheY-like chemotaxis protein